MRTSGRCRPRPAGAPPNAQEYQAKISDPRFDRIDLDIDVPAVRPADLALPPPAEGTARSRHASPRLARGKAHAMRAFRRAAASAPLPSSMGSSLTISPHPMPRASGCSSKRPRGSISRHGATTRVLRVARTLADLDRSDGVRRIHVAKALSYRRILPGADVVGR